MPQAINAVLCGCFVRIGKRGVHGQTRLWLSPHGPQRDTVSGMHLHPRMLALAFSLASASARAQSSSVDDLIRAGEAFEESAAWDRAARAYTEAATLNPASEAAYLHLGALRARTGDHREAAVALSVGLAHLPGSPALLRARSASLIERKHYEEAEADLMSLATMFPADCAILKDLAAVQRKRRFFLGELATWRAIHAKSEAAILVQALARIVDHLDPVSKPPGSTNTNHVRTVIAQQGSAIRRSPNR
jgi:tetratricopeptide (TPR) repeat protein